VSVPSHICFYPIKNILSPSAWWQFFWFQSRPYYRSTDNELNPLEQATQAIDELYSNDDTAPSGWHLKEQLRKGLRQQVRANVFKVGLKNWKDIPRKVDEYALKYYV
jgi:type I restriction enzyme R subunit